MKTLLFFLLCLLVCANLQAQETPNDFSDRIKSIFQHVDKTPVTTGILLDVGVDFSNLANFNGTVLVDSNYVNLKEWRSIYGSLLSSQFSNAASFTSFASFNTALNALTYDSLATPFVYLHYTYQELRSDAITTGLMYQSGDQLYDVSTRTESPYLSKTAFAIAPQKEYFNALGGYVSFTMPSALMFDNTGKTISTLKIDLGDGSGLQTRSINTPFGTTYSSSGYKTINYEITFTDSSTLISHSMIYVEVMDEEGSPGGGSVSKAYHSRVGHTIEISTPSGIKKAFLQIRLSNNHLDDNIIKPLIVVEGIDFWKVTTPNNPENDFMVDDFLEDALNKPLFPNSNRLNNEIDLLGYDVVFINFDEATDKLETNSLLVQESIKWVNLNKTGSTPNVVLGVSMGAVLARHALRTMEVNSISHQTSLYISMDGAHQGGNFPLGLQALVKHINKAEFSLFWGAIPLFKLIDMYPELKVAKELFDVPASKQLLYYRIGDGASLPIDNTEHDSFYASYHSLGMPSIRNIAISNGSECGAIQPFAPYTTLFEVDSVKPLRLPVVANIIDFFTAPYQVVGGLLTNRPFIGFGSILGVLSTKNTFVIEFRARALPNQTNQQIYKGFVGLKRKILGLFTVNSAITNRSVNAASYMLPLDNGAGGFADLQNGGAIGIPPGLASVILVPSFNYIPTVSSLDIGNGATTIGTAQLYAGYSRDSPPSSPYNTPFANFVTSATGNEDHVTFTSRNGDFLLKELAGTTTGFANCTIFCNPSSALICEPNQTCTTATYSIPNLPSGSTVSWSIVPSNLISLTPNGNSVTLTGNYGGEFNLRATINTVCGSINLPMLVSKLNYPDVSKIAINIIPCTGNIGFTYNEATSTNMAMRAPNTNYFEVESLDGTPIDVPSGGAWGEQISPTQLKTREAFMFNPSYTQIALRVRYKGPCGFTEWLSFGYNCDNNNSAMFSYYPNPTSNTLTVTQNGTTQQNRFAKGSTSVVLTRPYQIKLLDKTAKILVKASAVNGEDININTSNLPNGTYFLHIFQGKEVIKKQVIIQH